MKRVLIFLNYVAVFLLLLSYLSPFVDPQSFWPIALFGLLYPFFLIANLLFLLFWIIRRKKYFWLSLLTILIGWSYLTRYAQLGIGSAESEQGGKSLKLLSYNVRLFDLYNWKKDENQVTRENIYSFLRDEDAAVLCFQEYYADDSGEFSSVGHIVETQEAKFNHVGYTVSLGPSHWGIATFSRFPILNRGRVKFESKSNNICIFSDIVVGDDTMRIYNAHLGSIHFGYVEYQLLKKVGNSEVNRDSSGPLGRSTQIDVANDEQIPVLKMMVRMVKLLRTAFENRAAQAKAVAEHAASSPFPVIICGDINDTPVSYAYRVLAEGRRDAFKVSGSGFGNTYAGALPFFRIDYILCDDDIKIIDFQTKSEATFSDHFPISCKVEL